MQQGEETNKGPPPRGVEIKPIKNRQDRAAGINKKLKEVAQKKTLPQKENLQRKADRDNRRREKSRRQGGTHSRQQKRGKGRRLRTE